MTALGKSFCIIAIGLLFLAYSNFAPTSLASDQIADYVKNHFVREVIFGAALSVLAILAIAQASSPGGLLQAALLGGIVILPFWIGAAAGWSTGGMETVWGERIDSAAAYWLHGVQTALFIVGLLLMIPLGLKTRA